MVITCGFLTSEIRKEGDRGREGGLRRKEIRGKAGEERTQAGKALTLDKNHSRPFLTVLLHVTLFHYNLQGNPV